MAIVKIGTNNNIFTATLDAAAKTLTIKNVTTFSLNEENLERVYNITRSALFPGPISFTYNWVAGLPEYVWTFDTLPAATANGDTLKVFITVPDQFLDYTILQQIATATV